MDSFLSLLYSVIGGVIVGIFDFFFLRRQGELEERVQKLETEKIATLEKRVDAHLKEDNPQAVALSLKTLADKIDESNKLQRHSEIKLGEIDKKVSGIQGRMDAESKAKDKWMDNINESVQKHITDGRIHHYGK